MLVKESVDNKELLLHQQSVTTAKTTKEAQNPVYADAGRQMEKTAKIKADVVKVEEEPKRDEKPKAPKMTPGARKMYLDESLFESSDSNFDKVNLIVTKYLGNYLTDDELESATQSVMQSISKNSSDLVNSIRNGLLPYIRTEISFDDIKDIVPEIKGVLNIVTEAKNDIESKLYDELSKISAGVDKNGKPKHAEVYSNPQGNGYKIETELKNVIDEASKIAEKYKLPYRARPFRDYYLFTVDLPEKLTESLDSELADTFGYTYGISKSEARKRVAGLSREEKQKKLDLLKNGIKRNAKADFYETQPSKLTEGAKSLLRTLGRDDIQYFTHRNQFNYDIKQVRVNNKNKTYELGQFKIGNRLNSTQNGAEFRRLIDELKNKGYKEISKSEETLKEARIGKTKEVKVLQGNYGYGWDDLVTYDIKQFDNDYLKMMAEIRQDRKDYDNNEQGVAHRVITRRVPVLNESGAFYGRQDVRDIEVVPGYHEWVLKVDGKDYYSFGDVTDNLGETNEDASRLAEIELDEFNYALDRYFNSNEEISNFFPQAKEIGDLAADEIDMVRQGIIDMYNYYLSESLKERLTKRK